MQYFPQQIILYNDNTWNGTYSVEQKSVIGNIYTIEFVDEETTYTGSASASDVSNAGDNNLTVNFITNGENYTVFFEKNR